MQHFYAYSNKPTGSKASYRTLIGFSAKLLLVIALAFLVMMINISKAETQAKQINHPSGITESGTAVSKTVLQNDEM